MVNDHLLEDPGAGLVGRSIPPGRLRIERYEDWLARDCLAAAQGQDRPHPSWTLLGSFRGLGLDLVQLFEAMGARHDDGVMFGESSIEQLRPLEYERDYVVTGEFVGVARRRGRRVPLFDLVELDVTLADEAGPAVVVHKSFVVPRRER